MERSPHPSEAETLERTGRLLCDTPCSILCFSHLCPSRACLEWVQHSPMLLFASVCQCLSFSARVKARLLGLPASTGLQKGFSQIPSSYAASLASAKVSYCLLTTIRPIENPPSIPFPTHSPPKPGPVVAHMTALYPVSPSLLTAPAFSPPSLPPTAPHPACMLEAARTNEHILEASRQQNRQVLVPQVCDLSYMDAEA